MSLDAFASWGRRYQRKRTALDATLFFQETNQIKAPYLPYGNGRSYGDSCHLDRGLLIDQRSRADILNFDPQTGMLQAQAGILLSDIIAFVMPHGYFLPVTPGTQFVTLGGAIANDVHGKNHHAAGSFGCHVERFSVFRSDQGLVECSLSENPDLFAATIGGLGLTGIIQDASIKLNKVASPNVLQASIKFQGLSDYFDQIDAIDQNHDYSVAWIDQLATGKSFGRGVLMAANHHEQAGAGAAPKAARLSVPFSPPINLLNRLTLKAFNASYYGRARKGETFVPWASYFYPLDGIRHWNRLYGPRGLFQHQSVYPLAEAESVTAKLLTCAQRHGHASFLTVLKRFGAKTSPALMPFAREGMTLTLDFANSGPRTLTMLDALDDIVMQAGGAVNPYKDARMSADTFVASFPNWAQLEAARDPVLLSDFWQRTALRHIARPA